MKINQIKAYVFLENRLIINFMRIFILLFSTVVFSFVPNGILSQNLKIKIEKDKKLTVDEVFKLIMNQTDYKFFYEKGLFKGVPKFEFKKGEVKVEDLLAQSLTRGDLDVIVTNNNTILIKEKSKIGAIVEQNIKIKGTILDQSGMPLPGANIIEKGKSKGVQSDFDGNFALEVSSKNAVLVATYIGYVTQEVQLKGQTNISITLKEDGAQLEEVVVVGYGTQKKVNLTGAVSTVSAETLENRPITDATSALQGTVSGLNITKSSGQPGENSLSVQIRGVSSANGAVDPLVIIDGVTSSLSALSQTINPNDIESVSVLKDAAAASIYGVQASGGVILVTTKTGKEGKAKFDYSGQTSVSWALNLPERLSLLEEAKYSNLARANAGIGAEYSAIDLERIQNGVQYAVSTTDPNAYIYYNTEQDVRKMTLRDMSFMQTHNLNVSGGSEKTRYLVSMGYLEQDGVFKVGPDKFRRYNFRFNTTTELTKHLSLDSRISYAVHKRNQAAADVDGYGLFYNLQQARSRYPTYTPEGRYAAGGVTVFATLKDGGYRDKDVNDLDGVFTLTAKNFVKGLQFRAVYGTKYRVDDIETFKRTVTFWDKIKPVSYLNNPNSVDKERSITQRENFQFLTDYDLTIGKNNLHALVGYQYEDYRDDNLFAGANGLFINDLPTLQIGNPATKTNSESIVTTASQAVFGRLNYNYDEKYLVEATLRFDENSKLAPGLRTDIFPSVSAGWNMQKEVWFEKALPFVSEFKPRASWGQLGNALAGNSLGPYDFIRNLENNNALVFGGTETRSTYFYQKKAVSPQLSWETIETFNYGADLGFFDNKLRVNFDYFVKNNNSMLYVLDLPSTFGIVSPKVNGAKLETKGWEVNLNYRNKVGKDFKYNLGFNLSDSKNTLIDYGNGVNIIRSGFNNLIQGYPIQTIWGFKTKPGYIQDQNQLSKAAFYSNNTGIGDIEYVDIDGNGRIDVGAGTKDNHGDLVMLGSTQPRYFFGINGSAEYKNFDFSIFFQGVGERSFLPKQQSVAPFLETWFTAQKHQADYWTPENPNAAFPRPFLKGYHNYAPSDRWVMDGSYIRLKNVQIGYSLPQSLMDKVGIKRLRFYASAENIVTFSKLGVFKGVFDPEQKDDVRADYPIFGFAALGLNLTF